MSSKRKQSFLGGAAILAAAVAIVKVIGAFYKFPLNNILGARARPISTPPTGSTTSC